MSESPDSSGSSGASTPSPGSAKVRLARAVRRREQANQEYVEAILAARRAGLTMPEIGTVAGITKQAVEQLLRRYRRD